MASRTTMVKTIIARPKLLNRMVYRTTMMFTIGSISIALKMPTKSLLLWWVDPNLLPSLDVDPPDGTVLDPNEYHSAVRTQRGFYPPS